MRLIEAFIYHINAFNRQLGPWATTSTTPNLNFIEEMNLFPQFFLNFKTHLKWASVNANEPKNVRIRAGSVYSNISDNLERAELCQCLKHSCRELFSIIKEPG